MILVTGATGLVGAHLCLSLLKKNQKVVALYRREKKRAALKDFFTSRDETALFEKIQWREADLCLVCTMREQWKNAKKSVTFNQITMELLRIVT